VPTVKTSKISKIACCRFTILSSGTNWRYWWHAHTTGNWDVETAYRLGLCA